MAEYCLAIQLFFTDNSYLTILCSILVGLNRETLLLNEGFIQKLYLYVTKID